MSGLDKIIARLKTDCDAECAEIINKAQSEAEAALVSAKDESAVKSAEIIADAEKQAASIIKLARSTAEMKSRQSALSKKVQLLDSVLDDSLNSMNNMDDVTYFKVLTLLISKNAQSGKGVILMSPADFKKMPTDFVDGLNSMLAGKSSFEAKQSDSIKTKGIVLSYGDIEINLLFEELVYSNSDELKSVAQKILFK